MINRREALQKLASIAGLAAIGTSIRAGETPSTGSLLATPDPVASAAGPRKRALRVAHITDIHVNEKRHAPQWLAECFHKIQSEKDAPSLILNTGDCVMDSLKCDETQARRLWKIWNDVAKSDLSLPMRPGLGNHDCWGWGLPPADLARKDPDFGRQLGMEGLSLAKSYYSFDQGGWHFVMLESLQPGTGKNGSHASYMAALDDEQFNWLKNDIKATPASTPIMIMSHVPIMSAAAVWASRRKDDDDRRLVANTIMHSDANKLMNLFQRHPNVKIALSGHLHLLDRVDLNGVSYLCNGAVCGEWWKGYRIPVPGVSKGISPGYAMLNLYNDGSFDCEYKGFGWTDKYVNA
jgi:3',5'-cyclic AMP phosphodiesterase CpdA